MEMKDKHQQTNHVETGFVNEAQPSPNQTRKPKAKQDFLD